MDDVYDGARPDLLQILDVGAGVAAVRVGAVDTLGAEVVQLLEVSVHHNLLLVSVLQRFTSWNHFIRTGCYRRTSLQPGDVSTKNVHDDRLRDVVRVVSRHYLGHPQLHRSSVQGLTSEHPAEGAVVLEPHLGHDLVHGPAVQVLVGEDLQRDGVLVPVPLHSLQAVISVPSNTFIYGQQNQL